MALVGVAATVVVAAPAATAGPVGRPAPPLPILLPRGMTAAYVVFDRQTGRTALESKAHIQFRSASLVKIFIALDYLEKRGPDFVIPQADLNLLEPMLRASNDDAASTLWVREGWEQIVVRTVSRIGLNDTAPPASRGKWGYTPISAADIVKTYQYILDVAHPKYRDFIMGNLRQSAKCADDGFDQSFGIPSAAARPWAVKQGWSAYGAGQQCVAAQREALNTPEVRRAVELAPGEGPVDIQAVDTTSPLQHTSGTVGDGDRRIVVVLTLQKSTDWQWGANQITYVAREALRRAGA
jgi:hypothetical protein